MRKIGRTERKLVLAYHVKVPGCIGSLTNHLIRLGNAEKRVFIPIRDKNKSSYQALCIGRLIIFQQEGLLGPMNCDERGGAL